MSEFEQEFIIKCLDKLSQILSNKDKLNQAVTGFTQGNSKDLRYQMGSRITDVDHWKIKEIVDFKAAYSDAVFQVMHAYADQESAPIHEMDSAKQVLEETYIPKITSNTQSNDRIQSVIENIQQIRKDELKDKISLESEAGPGKNPSGFFTTELATSLLTAATVGLAIYCKSR